MTLLTSVMGMSYSGGTEVWGGEAGGDKEYESENNQNTNNNNDPYQSQLHCLAATSIITIPHSG